MRGLTIIAGWWSARNSPRGCAYQTRKNFRVAAPRTTSSAPVAGAVLPSWDIRVRFRSALVGDGGAGRDVRVEFKSQRSDQTTTVVVDFPQVPATTSQSTTRRVHNRVHRRVLRVVTLRRNANGSFSARKRLPEDVRYEYGERFGQRVEAKLFVPASKGTAAARQIFRDWETEIEGRIATIRAERAGEGVALTLPQARALAGEWYSWFVAKHPVSDRRKWEELQGRVQEALQDASGEDEWERIGPDELWREDPELRTAVRPVLADVGETAQFLAMKKLALTSEARDSFLDWLYEDLAAALQRLMRLADGDYSGDKYAASGFPSSRARTLA